MTPRLLSAAIVSVLLSSVAGTVLAANAAAAQTTDMDTVTVTAKLEAARNALSPDIGSSQFVITADDIDRLPLGASTPLNQVLLQAPGVVQDSYGGIHVRGDHANLQYRINGVMLPESISGFGQSLEPRIIKNLKLLDGALPAQFGDRTAAVVDITTKTVPNWAMAAVSASPGARTTRSIQTHRCGEVAGAGAGSSPAITSRTRTGWKTRSTAARPSTTRPVRAKALPI
ncbi:outer membrane cobalamin receptor protein [Xanthomonas vesicatoria ATCC 35937]|uniref:Outer membrane cobalamin receptor protein n=1 Tax=Xanthomonas vesicatoria ATCC 35937 TaxID=925775 RepID=F0BEV0_9XANT|nr:outer membrane cobalamin receptor protein [Xanthomonas vesicatoria ATCC 35937]